MMFRIKLSAALPTTTRLAVTAAIAVTAVTAVITAWPAPAAAADWPTYRGPHYDGRSDETGLKTQWSAEPATLWRVQLGNGYSGISVAGGRAFTQFGDSKKEYLVALAADTGKEIWRLSTGADRYDSQGRGPRSTPAVAGGTVYALSAVGRLVAANAETGEISWSRDLVHDFGAKIPTWGVSTSPYVHGDSLLLDVGGRSGYSLMALDRSTGEVRWSSQSDSPGYSTPIVVEIGGERQALFFTASGLVSVSPDDGRLFWRYRWRTSYDVNAAMPIFLPPDKVFLSSSYDKGAAVLKVMKDDDGFGVDEVWRSRVMKNHFNSSVLVDGYLYGFDDGTLKCIHAASGDEMWGKRGFAKGSVLYADGHIIIFGERGQLAIAEATPEGYRETGSAQVFRGKTWTMPTLADGVLFLRDEKELAALDLRR